MAHYIPAAAPIATRPASAATFPAMISHAAGLPKLSVQPAPKRAADHEGGVVAVDVEQAGLPEPVVVPVGPGCPGEAAHVAVQPRPALARSRGDGRQQQQAGHERQHGQGLADAREPVDLPVAQGDQQQAGVYQREPASAGPG